MSGTNSVGIISNVYWVRHINSKVEEMYSVNPKCFKNQHSQFSSNQESHIFERDYSLFDNGKVTHYFLGPENFPFLI
jgi:BioD-like phosphotransacetylase family protein